jgi:hypothetical protein
MGTSTSCDPLYRFTAQEFANRIANTYETVVTGAKADRDRYAWEEIGSPERMGEVRMAAIRRFLEDFASGLEKGRYRADRLPSLGFKNGEFDLALTLTSCSPTLSRSRQISTLLLLGRCAESLTKHASSRC